MAESIISEKFQTRNDEMDVGAQCQALGDFIAQKRQQKGCVLLDGAMGTALFGQGLQSGDSPELWNVEQSEKIKSVYLSYLKSGSDIILTNSFGGNRARLKLHQLESRVDEINQASAQCAWQAMAEFHQQDVKSLQQKPLSSRQLVAGSVGPLGELLAPLGAMQKDEAEALFYEQCAALKAGGADVIWIETMSLLDEVDAAYQGALRAGLPAAITLSFDMNGKTMMGVTEQDFCTYAQNLEVAPIAIGFNCGLGFSDSLLTLQGLLDCAQDIPVIAKSNCGLPVFKDDEIHFDGTPELMADYGVMARNAGAAIIGGCCGSSAEHIQHIAQAMHKHEQHFQHLDRDMIEAQFGQARAPENQSVAQIEAKINERKRNRRRG